MDPLQEGELILLAEDIPHTKYAKLCDKVGVSFARGQSILATHHNDYNVAMQHILMEWKTKQTDATQSRSILASKLRKMALGALGDKLSKGGYQPNQCDPRDNEAASLQSSSDIRTKISDSLTISQCRDKLKNVYLNELCKIPMRPWDRNDYAEFKDMHTRVTMVKKDARGKDTRKRETLEGSVAEIFSTKVNDTLPARILVSAPAGRGKTTAVAKIAYDWAHRVPGSALEHLPLLFVLKFRNTDKEMSIGEAIKSQLLSDVEDLTPKKLESFIKQNQNICHIILDGLDEYAGIADNKGLGSNIVDLMLWKTYRDCRVLVTTRPHLESFFDQGNLPIVYTKMWIEGFSPKSSRDYIDKFFASNSNTFEDTEGQTLKAYLDDQPLINELVITPLFCLMVCHLWSVGLLTTHTTTQTEVLDSVNVFFMHHANARSKSNYTITHDELSKIICKLGEVGLTGLLDAQRLVFKPSEFGSVPGILERAFELGILSKATTQLTVRPPFHDTSSNTIEFYHKVAQEHSAGKYLAHQTNKYLLRWKISKLDRVLQKIRANIGDYENLLRFAAGTENSLCVRIMEEILSNSFLDESERFRILLDCSSETKGTDGSVSSLVQRCVAAQRILLRSPTVHTVVGMQNLPGQLKMQVRQVRLEESAKNSDVTNGLWSCLGSFATLQTITISDSSLGFSQSPPELPTVTKLNAERVTSRCYEGLISSMPSLKEIDVTIDDVEGHTSQIPASSLIGQSADQQLAVHIKLQGSWSLSKEKETESGIAELGLLIRERTHNCQWLQVTGLKGQNEEAMVNLFIMSTYLKSLNLRSRCGSLNSDRQAGNISSLTIRNCNLTAVITYSMWSCLRSFPSLDALTISDSSLSFPPSPPELPSVTQLEAERVTSQSYDGLLSSLPGLTKIDIFFDDAERDISQITGSLRRTGGQLLRHIDLQASDSDSLPPEKKNTSRETMRGLSLLIREHIKRLEHLHVLGVKCIDEDYADLIESLKILPSLHFQFLGWGSLECKRNTNKGPTVKLGDCQLSTEMAVMLWSCLRSFPSLDSLIISDSSLSFPPSPSELSSVTSLDAKRVTSQSYEGLLSSLPGLRKINITVADAERDISQITASLRQTRREQLTDVYLNASDAIPQEKKRVSTETMRRLGLLIREQTKNLQELRLTWVKCTDEEDLVNLIDCCRHAKAMREVWLSECGTKRGGRLDSHLKRLLSSGDTITVWVWHGIADGYGYHEYRISRIH